MKSSDIKSEIEGWRGHCPKCEGTQIDTIKLPREMGEKSAIHRHLCLDCHHYCEGPADQGAGLLWRYHPYLATVDESETEDEMRCDACGCDVHVDDYCGNDKPDGTSEYLCPDCYEPTETETETMTRQERAEAAAYDDGVRCRRKGLGITASGLYDFTSWRRLFGRVCLPCPDREAAYDAWADGWYDEDERLSCLAQGVLPCGRPIGEA